jgi:N-acetyl-gamma-glutamyl-phosphate reductase
MHYVMHEVPVGVLGASGYAGRELCNLIARHPTLRLAFATANEQRGAMLRAGNARIEMVGHDEATLSDATLVFSALPHGASLQWVERARAHGCRVVDLSADLRPRPDGANAGIPYGLTELSRDAVRTADVVANPGCYPTSVLLALAPLFARGLVAPGATIVINSASGVTGAGNSPRRDLLFAEVSEDYRAYGVGNEHRHLAEMQATASAMGADVDLIFTPHLLPVARGILTTITVPLARDIDGDALDIWRSAFGHEPFVDVTDGAPALRDVVHTNRVQISARRVSNVRVPTLLVMSALDNLVKGAAGQAVQNANVMLGLDETLGLAA